MTLSSFTYIGTINTPFETRTNMPIQPTGARGVTGRVELLPEYQDGLKDLNGFSHIVLIYHFHESKGYKLSVTPFLDKQSHGVFATRAPKRPNPIGMSIVRLQDIAANTLYISDIDVLDGTPLLDIKPYVPAFDSPPTTQVRTGWLRKSDDEIANHRADSRFLTDD